jgi:hypothetical protein
MMAKKGVSCNGMLWLLMDEFWETLYSALVSSEYFQLVIQKYNWLLFRIATHSIYS